MTNPNIIGTEMTQELGEKLEKDTERKEEQWNKNEPPTTDDVRKATFFLTWCNNPQWDRASSFLRLQDHTQ